MADRRRSSKWQARLLFLFALLMTVGVGFILASDLLFVRRVVVQKGQAASQDIAAARRIEFPSEILTQVERQRAVAAVREVYDPLNRQIGREQVNLALQILAFVDSVRADPYAALEYRQAALQSITQVSLSPQVISDTLALPEDQWKVVQTETRRVLSSVMQNEIRSEQEDVTRRTVRTLIGLELNESQTSIVDEMARSLIRANRVYNKEATEAARQAALASVPSQVRVLEENQIIVRSGEIVTDLDIEALEALDLLTTDVDWVAVSGVGMFAGLLTIATCFYLWHGEPMLLHRPRHLLLLLLMLLTFTLLAKWGLGPTASQPYLLPLAMSGMLVTVLFGVRLGLVAQVLISLVVTYLTGGQTELLLYTLTGGLVGSFALRQVNRINAFTWAGLYVMLTNVAVVLSIALMRGDLNTLQIGELALAGVTNGALSAVLTLGGYYVLGMLFDITTTLQLLDLARPTHPAMRELLLKAPGTYHHSIMVGNMAEQAAEAVGANALLARVGAFYHDIGKTLRPYFFTENQMEGTNPHDLLDPATSAQIIRSHTKEGLDLARSRYHLPRVIQAFISEHHGTGRINYFYQKAVSEYGEDMVDEADYAHYGPTPQSKETAIVMMADTCEAAVRSIHPQNAEALEQLVRRLVSKMVSSGQLDNTPLTLREINVVTCSFVDTLQGVFHPRIRYPGDERLVAPLEKEPVGEVQVPLEESKHDRTTHPSQVQT